MGPRYCAVPECGCSVVWLSLELAKLKTRVQIPAAAPRFFREQASTREGYRPSRSRALTSTMRQTDVGFVGREGPYAGHVRMTWPRNNPAGLGHRERLERPPCRVEVTPDHSRRSPSASAYSILPHTGGWELLPLLPMSDPDRHDHDQYHHGRKHSDQSREHESPHYGVVQ